MASNLTINSTSQLNKDLIIASRVLSWINGIVFLYVAISQIAFCASRFKKTKEKCSNVLNVICAFAGVMTFLRIMPVVEEVIDLLNDLNCSIIVAFKTLTYGFAILSIWMLLWIRQRVFYQSPAMKHLTSVVTQTLSVATGVILVSGFFITQALFFATQKYRGTIDGCILENESYFSFLWIIIYLSGFIMQICLLFLFIYPLIKHRIAMKQYRGEVSASEPSIQIAIKRAAISAAVCIVMNAIAALTKYLVPASLTLVFDFVTDVNIGVEMIAVIWSFKSWRKRLFPWLTMRRNATKLERKSFTG